MHPGGINTRIATSGRRSERTSQGDAEAGLAIAAKALRMPPAKAERIILDAARRRTPRVERLGDHPRRRALPAREREHHERKRTGDCAQRIADARQA